eukprot:9469055-Pyramimonas_sp.AAC.1
MIKRLYGVCPYSQGPTLTSKAECVCSYACACASELVRVCSSLRDWDCSSLLIGPKQNIPHVNTVRTSISSTPSEQVYRQHRPNKFIVSTDDGRVFTNRHPLSTMLIDFFTARLGVVGLLHQR